VLIGAWAEPVDEAAAGAARRPPASVPMNARRSTRTPAWPLI